MRLVVVARGAVPDWPRKVVLRRGDAVTVTGHWPTPVGHPVRFSEPRRGVLVSFARNVVDVLIGADHYLYYPANIVQWLVPPREVASTYGSDDVAVARQEVEGGIPVVVTSTP